MARSAAGDVLSHVPDTGDTTTGRAVDDFVEQAADSLRALDEALTATIRLIDTTAGMPGNGGLPAPESQLRQAYRSSGEGEP